MATRKEIKLNKDSILALMQEVYNELVEQRNTAVRIQNKMLALMKDSEDMQTIGPVIKEQQKIINDCVEKKLTLSKLQATLWEKSLKDVEEFTIGNMEEIDETLVQNLLKKDLKNMDQKYKLD